MHYLLKELIAEEPAPTYWTWQRRHPKGYECSSKGDKRFSAFFATLPDGLTIEHHYQVNVKGWPSAQAGKGKPPRQPMTPVQLWEAYLNLWQQFAAANPELIEELRTKTAEHKILTDCFANTQNNQARALAVILTNTSPAR